MKQILTIILSLTLAAGAAAAYAGNVKEPEVAGAFYPAGAKELSGMLDEFLAEASPAAVSGHIIALVCPHAGYGYSGRIAADGYKLIRGMPYTTVVILGAAHHFGFGGVSVYPDGVFRTPLGDVPVDAEFAAGLLGREKDVYFEPRAFDKEHSVEVHIPFLQKTLKNFKIVPVVFGDTTLSVVKAFAKLLKEAAGDRRDVLVIASTDLYHGYDYDELEAVDRATIACMKELDAEKLYYGLRQRAMQACGGFGVTAAIEAALLLGYDRIGILSHTNSGDVTGRKIKGLWTVGYLSAAVYGDGKPHDSREAPHMQSTENAVYSKEQRKRLLETARSSIETYLTSGKKIEIQETDPALLAERGAFVTLTEHGRLRGCIGSMIGRSPLYLTVRDMAVEAAIDDPRFAPVKADELKNIRIEISVLSPLARVETAEGIKLGVHGVMVKRGFSSGVFLPQVAAETGWSKEQFLSYLCSQKAGLPAGAWKDKSTELYVFTAEVFSEDHY